MFPPLTHDSSKKREMKKGSLWNQLIHRLILNVNDALVKIRIFLMPAVEFVVELREPERGDIGEVLLL
jgi:hypothetical protein